MMAVVGAGSASAADRSPQASVGCTSGCYGTEGSKVIFCSTPAGIQVTILSGNGGWGAIQKKLMKIPGVSYSITEEGFVFILPYIEP